MKLTFSLTCLVLTFTALVALLHVLRSRPTADLSLQLHTLRTGLLKANGKPARTNEEAREVLTLFDFSLNSSDPSKCYPLKVNPPAVICVYEDTKDIWVSKSLRLYGTFEPSIEANFKQALRHDPELDVIDIGANLGLYSLIAAAMGRKTISVEPLQTNINHFHKSVKMNTFENKISLLTNAVSNQREKVYFKLNPINQGGTRMFPKKLSCIDGGCPFAWSILMDDILPLAIERNITKAIMKIDIEGSEHLALSEASKLFTALKIPYIFMEFVFQRGFCGFKQADTRDKRLSNKMFKFLREHGYTRVYASDFRGRPLRSDSCTRWPNDIIWVHKSCAFPL